MGLLDALRKPKPELSAAFRRVADSLLITVRANGGSAVAKIMTFSDSYGTLVSSMEKYRAKATESAKQLVATLDSEFFSDIGIKEKLAGLKTAAETQADRAFFSQLNKLFTAARNQALSIPKLFENPISFKNRDGIGVMNDVATKINEIIYLLDSIEK